MCLSCSLILLSVEVTGAPEEEARRLRPQPLPWFGSADPGERFCRPPRGQGQL